jgi:hypothetical protein
VLQQRALIAGFQLRSSVAIIPFPQMSHALKLTTVISLLQPPPEVFSLFDDLMFLCEGRMLYHGPLEGAVPHFTASGFICPVRKDVASFLLEITTPTGTLVAHTAVVLAIACMPPHTTAKII